MVDVTFETVLPVSFKFIIDDALLKRDGRLLTLLVTGLIAGGVLVSVLAVARDRMYATLGSSLLNDLRARMFRHLQELPMAFYARSRPGDISARFTTDLAPVEQAVTSALPVAFTSLLSLVMGTVIMFAMQWKLALLAVLGLPLCLLGPRLLGGRTSDANSALKDGQAEISNAVQENTGAQHVVKAFGLQERSTTQFQQLLGRYMSLSVRASFLGSLLERTPNLAILAFNLLIICLGAVLAFRGMLTVGTLITFQGLFAGISSSVYAMTCVLPQFVQAAAGMERIEQLLAEPVTVADRETPLTMRRPSREIEFRDVTFSYTTERRSLDNVSLTIPHGSFVAFVGPSGSGKSTILNMLMRFYDAESGAVLIDGVDLRDVSQASLRANMGVVLQDNFLFNAPIRENIALGNPTATLTEIEAAGRAAEIHDFIAALPQGYETSAGERGGRLSGGQRQRVAIARALLRDPAILLLDEATSALDPGSEAEINRMLLKVAGSRTIASITHRLSSVQQADCIFVMDQGRLVEQGSHRKLLERGGLYAGQWQKQSGFTLSEGGDSACVSVERLQAFPILKQLDRPVLSELAGLFVAEQYPAGRIVVQQGDPGDKFYIIVRGRVEVLKDTGSGPRRVNVFDDGDHFGETALLRNSPRLATVQTMVPSLFLTLPRHLFLQFVDRAPGVRSALEAQADRYLQTASAPE